MNNNKPSTILDVNGKPAFTSVNASESSAIIINGNSAECTITVKKTKGSQICHSIRVKVDFGDCERSTMMTWAMRNRIIALQDALRKCSDDYLKILSKEGVYRLSKECGKSFDDSTQQQKAEKLQKGIGELAPELQDQLLAKLLAEKAKRDKENKGE